MDNTTHGSTYWRSLRELYTGGAVSEAKAHEFLSGVTEDFRVEDLSTMSRKKFLALVSASAAFAAAGCSNYRDKGTIVPYTKKPEEVLPGVANLYASTCAGCANACGILIKTREGRPIKVDGNPDHPVNRGKVCATGQASVLNLYDPNRLRSPFYGLSSGRSTNSLTWAQADTEIMTSLKRLAGEGRRIVLVTKAVTSPTAKSAIDVFRAAYPTADVVVYDEGVEASRRAAWKKCYDDAELPGIAWEKADVIVSLDGDFLGTEGHFIEATRRFTQRRDLLAGAAFNRLYVVEGGMSVTGSNADHRLRLRPDAQLGFVLALLNELGSRGAITAPALAAGRSLKAFAETAKMPWGPLDALVTDLAEKKGRSVVVAGAKLPEAVHVAVNLLNELLGNTALYEAATSVTHLEPSTPAQVASLVAGLRSASVGAVIHVDTNPLYHLPPALGYQDALTQAQLTVALVEQENETSVHCQYVLPIHHAFEAWGDHQVRSGVWSLQQPVIAPLYDTRQKEAILLAWARGSFTPDLYHDFLRTRWEKEVYPLVRPKAAFTAFWHGALHDGVVTADVNVSRGRIRPDALAGISAPEFPTGTVVSLTTAHYIGDGSFGHNGWLQELPHPISKIVWDNYASVSVAMGAALGVENNDLIEVSTPSGTVALPVFLMPGQADDTISVDLGYGRRSGHPVATGVGFDVHPLVDPTKLEYGRTIPGATVKKAAGRYELASTQEHHSLDDTFVKDLHLQRKIIREGTVGQYAEDPHFLHEDKPELFSITQPVEYQGVKWAMAIDLNKCTGCNACVAGCNVENNIPVIGKDQVARGREMQWLRIDRYFSGTPEAPQLSHQPMLCQHCDNAPCENVCPVVATTHSPDGLNQMVYNRCVGTKYCSNNCPYKVRRFNFYNFRDNYQGGYYEAEVMSLAHNPEVTVRSRGVMEKCTFCVQRIMDGKQKAGERGETWIGQGVTTACQQACPAEAIVFGNVNDPDSAIAKARAHSAGYRVLEEINVRPNVTYIAKLRNTEKEASA
jgi:Fe-S-cluster-containing dehydrogenase component/anaerobic selenocysteine-containing dehydrogenase